MHQKSTHYGMRELAPNVGDYPNIRKVIKTQLFATVDFEAITLLAKEDLVEQATFVVEELARRNWFIIDRKEIKALARHLAQELMEANRKNIPLH